MDKFTGTIDELKAEISAAGLEGTWSSIEHGHCFRTKRGGVLSWFPSRGTVLVQGSKEGKDEISARLSNGPCVEATPAAPLPIPPAERPKVFVVHGHDVQAREQLELILHRLGLEPFVLANTGGDGLTLIEALEQELAAPANRPHFGIVLMTPEDTGYAREAGELGSQPSRASERRA